MDSAPDFRRGQLVTTVVRDDQRHARSTCDLPSAVPGNTLTYTRPECYLWAHVYVCRNRLVAGWQGKKRVPRNAGEPVTDLLYRRAVFTGFLLAAGDGRPPNTNPRTQGRSNLSKSVTAKWTLAGR